MALDTLEIFGDEYTSVAGFKATDDNGNTKTYIRPQGTISISANGSGIDVSTYASANVSVSPNLESKSISITPTESSQSQTVSPTTPTYDGLSSVNVTVNAISSTYVGTGITRRDSSDLSASGATVSVPSGYYENNESISITNGSATTPATSVTATPSISIDSSGLITASVSTTKSITPTVVAGYISSGTSGTVSVSGSATYQLTVRDSTDMSAIGATVTAPSGYYASSATYTIGSGSATPPSTIVGYSASVSIGINELVFTKTISVTPVVSAGYISAGTSGNVTVSLSADITSRNSSDLVTSGDTVTAPAGYYPLNATATIASGTEGTPTATKGVVSSHSISVTPSVTNTAGYIGGGTHTGTAVTVTAAELVSGSQTITTNNTYDVTNLAEVVVAVSGCTRTATITGSGNSSSTYVTYNGTKYYTNGDTFTFSDGDTLSIKCEGLNGSATITVEGVQVAYNAWNAVTYNYTLPSSDITIDLFTGTSSTVNITAGSVLNLQTKTGINPTTSSQTITYDVGYDGLASVQINAMPSGTAGTPIATKGAVNSHSIAVTPSVTNSSGYISGGSITGTAVSVTASELVSGTLSISTSGTHDVTNYQYASVSFSTVYVSTSNPAGGNDGDIWIKTAN